jgi:hypothetical protein
MQDELLFVKGVLTEAEVFFHEIDGAALGEKRGFGEEVVGENKRDFQEGVVLGENSYFQLMFAGVVMGDG